MENEYIGLLVFVVAMVTSMVVYPLALKFAKNHDLKKQNKCSYSEPAEYYPQQSLFLFFDKSYYVRIVSKIILFFQFQKHSFI